MKLIEQLKELNERTMDSQTIYRDLEHPKLTSEEFSKLKHLHRIIHTSNVFNDRDIMEEARLIKKASEEELSAIGYDLDEFY
jgi:hypothetical protein